MVGAGADSTTNQMDFLHLETLEQLPHFIDGHFVHCQDFTDVTDETTASYGRGKRPHECEGVLRAYGGVRECWGHVV